MSKYEYDICVCVNGDWYDAIVGCLAHFINIDFIILMLGWYNPKTSNTQDLYNRKIELSSPYYYNREMAWFRKSSQAKNTLSKHFKIDKHKI